MKLCTLILTLLSVTHVTAAPTDIWAAGVSQESGWKDYNKKFDGRDDEQCWAITAANLIDWWQSRNPDKVSPDTPQGEQIMQTFVQSFGNAGSDPDEGLSWWFSGDYTPGRKDCASREESATGAYLQSALPPGKTLRNSLLAAMRGSQVNASTASTALLQGAQAGAAFWIGVSYVSPKGRPAMHSLNVWGVRCDEDNTNGRKLLGIWIADSDDYRTGLTYVPVREDKGMLVFDCPQHPIYGNISRIVIDTISSLAPGH